MSQSIIWRGIYFPGHDAGRIHSRGWVGNQDVSFDMDLNFSPVANTLPIRRLNLGIGEHGFWAAD